MSKARPNPRPWSREGRFLYSGRKKIAELPQGGVRLVLVDEANGDLIVRAVNAHEDLTRELAHLIRLLEPLERDGSLNVPGLATLNGARAALEKARP